MTLTGKQKKYLKQKSHSLKPLILLGKHGLTSNLLKQIKEVVLDHELLKIKILDTSPVNKKDAAVQICNECDSEIIQSIGKTLVIYRANSENPSYELPPAGQWIKRIDKFSLPHYSIQIKYPSPRMFLVEK